MCANGAVATTIIVAGLALAGYALPHAAGSSLQDRVAAAALAAGSPGAGHWRAGPAYPS